MSNHDYRAVCAELIDAIDSGISTDRMHLSPVMLRARALLAGYQAHLVKPYQIGQLVLIVDELLGARRASEVLAAAGPAGRHPAGSPAD